MTILLSAKATVPIQAFISQLVKMTFRHQALALSVPEFAIDGLVGTSHICILQGLASLPVCTQPNVVPTIENNEVAVTELAAEELATITVESSAQPAGRASI